MRPPLPNNKEYEMMLPTLLDSVCGTYEREIAALTTELRETRELLARAQALNLEQAVLLAQQGAVIESVRETAAAVRDGCVAWERGQMQAFGD